MDYLLVLATISLIRTELGPEYDYKMSLILLKMNNNQGFSEPLSKQFYFMKAQSIPFWTKFEQLRGLNY